MTVTGRFRGRNLYGDLPEAPGTSLTDFVLRSADAAVWIVGKKPRGDGFDLDVLARVDTGRWLQITGIVKGSDRLVEIEAEEIEQVERPDRATQAPTSTADVPKVGPSPEVIFSAPTQDDTGVATDVLVRFQFSRDMVAESFEGNVAVEYFGAARRTAAAGTDGTGLEFDVEYRPRNRVINVSFTEPLLPYRTVRGESRGRHRGNRRRHAGALHAAVHARGGVRGITEEVRSQKSEETGALIAIPLTPALSPRGREGGAGALILRTVI